MKRMGEQTAAGNSWAICLLTLLLACCLAGAVAEPADASDFTYTVLNGIYCAITSYTGEAGEIVIPGSIDVYMVQSISIKHMYTSLSPWACCP